MSGIPKDAQYIAGTTVKIAVTDTPVSLGDAGNLAIIQPVSGAWANCSATKVLITVVTNPIYYTPGGTTPATDGSIGHPLALNAELEIKSFANIKAAKFVRQSTSSGAIMVTPFFNGAGK